MNWPQLKLSTLCSIKNVKWPYNNCSTRGMNLEPICLKLTGKIFVFKGDLRERKCKKNDEFSTMMVKGSFW